MKPTLPTTISRAPVLLLAALLLTPAARAQTAAPRAAHVVIIVMDGLRPDSVTPQDMPTVAALAHAGTTFAHHHPVFVSSTEVNGTALATGAYPDHSGVYANRQYLPAIDPLQPVDMQSLAVVRRGDTVTAGHFLRVPTVVELARRAGKTTAIAGTKDVAVLWDRADRRDAHAGVNVFGGQSLPRSWLAGLPRDQRIMPPPVLRTRSANAAGDHWTTRTLTEHLWAQGVPALSVLWLSEPDFAQHGTGPGSDVARAALHSDDDCVAQLLAALDKAGVRASTDVFIVSDHGFSTVWRRVDMTAALVKAGFNAVSTFTSTPVPGQVLVVGNGGEVSFHVIGGDAGVVSRLVAYLQSTDFVGVILTRKAMPGTFAMGDVSMPAEDGPDVIAALRWNDEKSATGMNGKLVAEGVRGVLLGQHASLSRYDMHNTLIACGPDFRKGFVDALPSGNADVAPTVAWILGMPAQAKAMDGRVLSEAIEGLGAPMDAPVTTTEIAKQEGGPWRQYLRVTRIGPHVYFDEGNAGAAP